MEHLTKAIAEKLVQAIKDPYFGKPDGVAGRTGHDYAFDGLWLLMSGGPLGGTRQRMGNQTNEA